MLSSVIGYWFFSVAGKWSMVAEYQYLNKYYGKSLGFSQEKCFTKNWELCKNFIALKSVLGTSVQQACNACLKLVHLAWQCSTKWGGKFLFFQKKYLSLAFLTYIFFLPLGTNLKKWSTYNKTCMNVQLLNTVDWGWTTSLSHTVENRVQLRTQKLCVRLETQNNFTLMCFLSK